MTTPPFAGRPATRHGRLRAAFAVLLTLVMPGLGHILARAWRPGLAVLAAGQAMNLGLHGIAALSAPVAPALTALAALLLAYVVLLLAAAVDAWRRVRLASPGPRPGWFRSTWFVAAVVLALGVALDATLPLRWRAFSIPSASMAPTLMVGDYLMADTRPWTPARGDVLIFTEGTDHETDYVKRVIALPGDRIALVDGDVLLNGTPLARRDNGEVILPEPLSFGIKARRFVETLPDGPSYPVLALPVGYARNRPEQVVPPGHLFMMGDNRDNSRDSRAVGPIPIADVVARAVTLYWSNDRTRILMPLR